MPNEKLLQSYITERMKERKLTLRKIARETGVSHTTIARIVQGKPVGNGITWKICTWLGVRPSVIIDNTIVEESLEADLTFLLAANPPLKKVFQNTLTRFKGGDISKTVMYEILAYTAFRLGLELDSNEIKDDRISPI